MRLFIILAAILTTGCATSYATFIDPEFRQYSSEFFDKSRAYIPPIVIKFGKVSPGDAAICKQFNNGQTEIVVSKQDWAWLRNYQRRGLIFHELGHCILNREHVETVFSYMYDTLQDEMFYMTNIDQLDNEMFR